MAHSDRIIWLTSGGPDGRLTRCVRGLPWGKVSASGIIDVLGNFAFALALSRAPLLPVALLSGMYPVATAALAWLVVGERLAVRQRWGGGAAVVGAALMAAS